MLKRWLRRHFVFVLTVLLPTLGAVLYYGLLASDVYVSESRFVVRSLKQLQQQSTMSSGLMGNLLQSSGLSHSGDDAYPVQDYMLSTEAVRELDQRLAVLKHYGDRGVDVFSRYPGLDWNGSFENFVRYYRKHVSVVFDTDSSISTLIVKAYSAEQAQQINRALLEMGEKRVNDLNERSRNDMIRFAEQDVAVAEDGARKAANALLEYRSRNGVYEPNKQAEVELDSIQKLQEELIETQTQVVELMKLASGNPQITALKGRLDSLRDAITAEAAKVTNPTSSLAVHSARMQALLTTLDFADHMLGTTLGALEQARSQARRQELYIDRVVEPNLPDYAMEPRRVRMILTVLAVGLMLWGVVGLVMASVREHTD